MKINFAKKKARPKTEGNLAVKYGPAKRVVSYLKWRITVLLVLSPFFYFLAKLIFSLIIAPTSGFINLNLMNYYSPCNGIIVENFAREGIEIEKEDLLVTLKNEDLENRLALLETELRLVTKRIRGPEGYDSRPDMLKMQIDSYGKALEFAESRYKDICFLFEQGAATMSELASAKSQLDNARERFLTAQYSLRQLQDKKKHRYMVDYETADMNADRTRLRQQIAQLENKMGKCMIKALEQGRIVSANLFPGQYVTTGESLFTATHGNEVKITAFLSPRYTDRARRGKIVNVVLPSKTTFKASVMHAAKQTDRLPAYLSTPMLGRRRMVVVDLKPLSDLPPDEMIDGLPVEVFFESKFQKMLRDVKEALF